MKYSPGSMTVPDAKVTIVFSSSLLLTYWSFHPDISIRSELNISTHSSDALRSVPIHITSLITAEARAVSLKERKETARKTSESNRENRMAQANRKGGMPGMPLPEAKWKPVVFFASERAETSSMMKENASAVTAH